MANNMDKKNNAKNGGGAVKGNPIQHIKHLVKDPINTIEEAEARKKEIKPWLFGSLGVAVLGAGLANIEVLSFMSIFGLIGIFGVMLFGFLLFVIKKAKEKFKALTCNKCNTMAVLKTPAEFAEFVSYSVGKNEAVFKGVKHPASNNGVVSEITASASASVVVTIDLKCPHCGNVKKLEYHIVPFKCSAKQRKVAVRDVELVKMKLENAVRAAVTDYNNPEKRENMPYSIHSINHPNYENRDKVQLNNSDAYPDYNGAKIDYRKEPEEMVEQFFIKNQLDGKIIDLSSPKK